MLSDKIKKKRKGSVNINTYILTFSIGLVLAHQQESWYLFGLNDCTFPL
jgi:hypothetical protein